MPSTFGKELKVFSHRLQNEIRIFKSIEIYGKFSGTTGNFHTLSLISTTKNWSAFINSFGRTIGLQINPITTQIDSHDSIASFAHSMVRINNILRRAFNKGPENSVKFVVFGPFQWDEKLQTLSKDGENVYLTSLESKLMSVFSQNHGKIINRFILETIIKN